MTKMLSKVIPATNLYTRKSAKEVESAVNSEASPPTTFVITSTGTRPYLSPARHQGECYILAITLRIYWIEDDIAVCHFTSTYTTNKRETIKVLWLYSLLQAAMHYIQSSPVRGPSKEQPAKHSSEKEHRLGKRCIPLLLTHPVQLPSADQCPPSLKLSTIYPITI